jgi:hypothetical protein
MPYPETMALVRDIMVRGVIYEARMAQERLIDR